MKKMILSAVGSILLATSPSLAFNQNQLDPSVAQPLLAMYQAAFIQCQMGNQMGCQYGQQIQGAAHEMLYYQTQCQRGNSPQACQQYQMGAARVFQTFQQFQGMRAPIHPNPSFGQLSHEQRMRLQRRAFSAHNQQWHDRQIREMNRNQRFLDNLLK